MSDDQNTIPPEEFGRRFAEAALPILTEGIRQTLDQWSDEQKNAQAAQATPQTPEWRGGAPTSDQVRVMLDKTAPGASNQDIVSVLEEIKGILQTMQGAGVQT